MTTVLMTKRMVNMVRSPEMRMVQRGRRRPLPTWLADAFKLRMEEANVNGLPKLYTVHQIFDFHSSQPSYSVNPTYPPKWCTTHDDVFKIGLRYRCLTQHPGKRWSLFEVGMVKPSSLLMHCKSNICYDTT